MSGLQETPASQEEEPVAHAFLHQRLDAYFKNPRRSAWPAGEHILVGRSPGADAIRLQSNDYLGMAAHPNVLQAVRAQSTADDSASIMAAVFLHGANPQSCFETAMAKLLGSEATVLSQSGWAANTGLLQAVVAPGTPVYIDMFAHMSLHEGAQIARAQVHRFMHNSVRSLERQVRQYGPGFIVVDAVYSTSGAVAPLREMVQLAERLNCVLIVDEAHSLGTHGPRGAGLVAELGLTERVHFRTFSLAKAFAGRAGLVACSAEWAELVKYSAHPAIFSSGLMPSEIARLDAIREQIEHADDRRIRLAGLARRLRAGLRELGYDTGASESQIVSLQPGEEWRTMKLRDALEARGVFGSVFCAPATPVNASLLRMTVHSELTEQQIDQVLAACAAVRDEVCLEEWGSTRRLRARMRTTDSTSKPSTNALPNSEARHG